MSKRVVGIVGTMDTKGPEFAFVKERIEALGLGTLVVNAGIAGEPKLEPDVGAEEVAVAANTTLAALRAEGDRGASVAAMAAGVEDLAPYALNQDADGPTAMLYCLTLERTEAARPGARRHRDRDLLKPWLAIKDAAVLPRPGGNGPDISFPWDEDEFS